MNSIKKILATTLLGGLLSGCADEPPIISIKPPPLENISPKDGLSQAPVAVGDVFVYDNPPERWEVIAIDSHYIAWRNGNNGFKQTSWSTLLPDLQWETADSSGRRTITVDSGQLHPLKKGNKISFTEETLQMRSGDIYSHHWKCEVQDQVELVVKAGKVKTWPVLCLMDGREQTLFNYAESLGSYVRIVIATPDGSPPVSRQLTGYAHKP